MTDEFSEKLGPYDWYNEERAIKHYPNRRIIACIHQQQRRGWAGGVCPGCGLKTTINSILKREGETLNPGQE